MRARRGKQTRPENVGLITRGVRLVQAMQDSVGWTAPLASCGGNCQEPVSARPLSPNVQRP